MSEDAKKIAFISCVNDEEMYDECVRYLKHIEMPQGFSAQLVPVRGAPSMAAGYEAARRASSARYKVYLHQDILLTEKSIAVRLLELFQARPEVGLIGFAGCRRLPSDGVWWNAKECYGSVWQIRDPEAMVRVAYRPVPGGGIEAEAIDGMFLATQTDVPWREDIFTGWHFYDISAAMEHRRRGLCAFVPHFERPPCIHETGRKRLDEAWEKARQVFLAEYGEELQQGGEEEHGWKK